MTMDVLDRLNNCTSIDELRDLKPTLEACKASDAQRVVDLRNSFNEEVKKCVAARWDIERMISDKAVELLNL